MLCCKQNTLFPKDSVFHLCMAVFINLTLYQIKREKELLFAQEICRKFLFTRIDARVVYLQRDNSKHQKRTLVPFCALLSIYQFSHTAYNVTCSQAHSIYSYFLQSNFHLAKIQFSFPFVSFPFLSLPFLRKSLLSSLSLATLIGRRGNKKNQRKKPHAH